MIMVGIAPHAGDRLVAACVATALAALVIADVGEVLAQAAVDVAVVQDSVRTLEGGAQKASPVFSIPAVALNLFCPGFARRLPQHRTRADASQSPPDSPDGGTAASWLAA